MTGLTVSRPLPRPAIRARVIERDIAVVAVVTLAAAILRFAGLGAQSFWYDEAHTVWVIHFGFGVMLGHLSSTETSPPGYFVLAWLWSHVLGSGTAGLRSLSAVAGTLTVPVAYAAAARLLSRRAGLIAAALTAGNPLLIWYSQEARSYALMVLFTGVALLAFVHLREGPRRRWALVWGVAAAAAMATHYYSGLALLPQGAWLIAHHRRDRHVRIALALATLATLALVPLVRAQVEFLNAGTSWITRIPLGYRAGQVPTSFAVGPEQPWAPWPLVVTALAVAIAIGLAALRADADERRAIGFAARVSALGFALVGALVACGYDQLNYRNMLALWLPLALAVAGALGARRAGRLGVGVAAVLCAAGAAVALGVLASPALQRPDWRAVARAVGDRPGRAIFIVNGCQLLPLSAYVPGLAYAPLSGTPTRTVDVISAGRESSWTDVLSTDWYVTCIPSPGPLSVPARLAGFTLSRRTRVGRFTVTELTARRPRVISYASFRAAGLRGELIAQRRTGSSAPVDGSAVP